MKAKAKYIFNFMVTVFMAVMVCSCADEPLVQNDEYGKGPVQVSFAVSFEPSAETLTRATAGNAIKDIKWLAIVLYNESKELVDVLEYTSDDLNANNIDRTQTGNQPTDYPSDKLSESSTPKVTPKEKSVVAIGKYYMYAVANVDENTKQKIRSKSTDIDTPEKLKAQQAVWDRTNIPSNSQMFGYFTPGTNGESVGFDAPLVTVDGNNLQFHAWVKRCASKVTIVYDGSGLHEDIFVYIHKVTIHDIPKTCYLGQENSPVRNKDYEEQSGVWQEGESIYYNAVGQQLATSPTPNHNYNDTPEPATYQKWMRIGRGSDLKGAVEADGTTTHSETSTALYFYENAQGNYPDQQNYYKPQIWENVGTNVYEGDEDFKDNVVNGTYIEVEAYYVSKHAPGISQGKIKYRFMLGQDTQYDYNAFRNRHYKLTLKFKGYANQPDWHIEYIEEEPEIYTPDEFYVSYLYNKQHMFPMRVIGNCEDLEVEIIRNDWHPYDPSSRDEVPDETIENEDEIFRWNRDVWENSGFETTGEIASTTTTGNNRYYGRHKYTYTYNDATDIEVICTPPHVGFLSLTVPSAYENGKIADLPKLLFSTSGTHWYSPRANNASSASLGQKTVQALRDYYYAENNKGDATATNDIPQNKRKLNISQAGYFTFGNQTSSADNLNAYKVEITSDNSKIITLPLWTRPFSMIYISGFSGNNPFEAYQRKALLRIRGRFTIGGERVIKTKTVPVYQVRRIINPKAVWRNWDNTNTFHVTLMQRRDAAQSSFETFESEGPWKASITAKTDDFCSLSGENMEGETVVGKTDDIIDFEINFKPTAENHSACAIITVLYHGNNCEHTIFVRKGYHEPLQIVEGGAAWSSYCLYAANGNFGLTGTNKAKGILTTSPLSLGTFFKRGNYNDGIITQNNITYGKLAPLNGGPLELRRVDSDGTSITSDSKTWPNIDGKPYTNYKGNILATKYTWADIQVGDRTYALPEMSDYLALQSYAEVGFGVLYGSGATEVGTTFDEAFGHKDPYNESIIDTKGMRGVIAYNATTAKQVFFPVGITGVGRRTIQNANSTDEIGILRYGSQSGVLSISSGVWNEHRPISYNLPNNAGAIYWAKNSDGNNNLAWDINFVDLNFSPYDYGCCWGRYGTYEQGDYNTASKGDALPIKLIYKPNASSASIKNK